MRSRWIDWKYRFLYSLSKLMGRASSTSDWGDLSDDPAYEPTRLLLESLFAGYYAPYDWEPLHRFYEDREQPLPPPSRLSREVAVCAVEFLIVLHRMKQHRLPPDFLSSLMDPGEIDFHVRQTQRYLALIRGGESWPLGYFYAVAPHILRKRGESPVTTAETLIEKKEPQPALLSRLFSPLSA